MPPCVCDRHWLSSPDYFARVGGWDKFRPRPNCFYYPWAKYSHVGNRPIIRPAPSAFHQRATRVHPLARLYLCHRSTNTRLWRIFYFIIFQGWLFLSLELRPWKNSLTHNRNSFPTMCGTSITNTTPGIRELHLPLCRGYCTFSGQLGCHACLPAYAVINLLFLARAFSRKGTG